jgi:hypothetical protein
MHCCDTNGEILAVRLEHLTVKDVRKLNRIIGKIKEVFEGNAGILLIYTGGKLGKAKIVDTNIPLIDEE